MQLFYPDEPAVLQPEMLAAWKQRQGIYNFTSLPGTAIICNDFAVLKGIKSFRAKRIKGIKGVHFIKNGLLFCTGFDNGAPGIISLLEELKALKVRRFVFAGWAGILNNKIPEGTSFIIRKAITAPGGAVSYYSEANELCAYDLSFYKSIKDGLEFEENICFSVDTPFRETNSLLDGVEKQGAQLIEMECAAVYAFAHFYRLAAVCLLTTADRIGKTWQPPESMRNIMLKQKQFIQKTANLLS